MFKDSEEKQEALDTLYRIGQTAELIRDLLTRVEHYDEKIKEFREWQDKFAGAVLKKRQEFKKMEVEDERD